MVVFFNCCTKIAYNAHTRALSCRPWHALHSALVTLPDEAPAAMAVIPLFTRLASALLPAFAYPCPCPTTPRLGLGNGDDDDDDDDEEEDVRSEWDRFRAGTGADLYKLCAVAAPAGTVVCTGMRTCIHALSFAFPFFLPSLIPFLLTYLLTYLLRSFLLAFLPFFLHFCCLQFNSFPSLFPSFHAGLVGAVSTQLMACASLVQGTMATLGSSLNALTTRYRYSTGVACAISMVWYWLESIGTVHPQPRQRVTTTITTIFTTANTRRTNPPTTKAVETNQPPWKSVIYSL